MEILYARFCEDSEISSDLPIGKERFVAYCARKVLFTFTTFTAQLHRHIQSFP